MYARKLVYLAQLLKSQYNSPEKIKDFQLKRLNFMISYCYKYVRFYRKVWKLHNAPKKVRRIEDIKKFPTIDRRIVLENYSEFLTEDTKKKIFDDKISYNRLTSGTSTGHSFRIIVNESAWDLYEAIYLRAFLNVGFKPWEKMTYYWYEDFKRRFYNSMLLRKDVVLASLPFYRQIELIEKFNNPWIYYFSSILYILSRINEKFITEPKGVITHAEILSPRMKRRISKAFNGAPVFDQYGSTEFNRMAWECPESGLYHVDDEAILLELIDKSNEEVGENEIGEVVVTGLWNTTFPLIRYKIGDLAIRGDTCSCGRGLSTLRSIVGRKEDVIINKKGKFITPSILIDIFDQLEFMKEFRLTFNKNILLVEFVPSEKTRQENTFILKKIRESLREFLPKIRIRFKEMDSLSPTPRGKFKLVDVKREGLHSDLIKLDPFSQIK